MHAGGAPPPSVAGLAGLRRACFAGNEFESDDEPSSLPDGPWAASLRTLGASYALLQHSGRLLAAAHGLEQLGVLGCSTAEGGQQEEGGCWERVAALPQLQLLQVDALVDEQVPAALLAAVSALQGARPGLRVLWHRTQRHDYNAAETCALHFLSGTCASFE